MSSRVFQSVIIQMKEATDRSHRRGRRAGVCHSLQRAVDDRLAPRRHAGRARGRPGTTSHFQPSEHISCWARSGSRFDYAVFRGRPRTTACAQHARRLAAGGDERGAAPTTRRSTTRPPSSRTSSPTTSCPETSTCAPRSCTFVTDVPGAPCFPSASSSARDVAALEVVQQPLPGQAEGLRPLRELRRT